MTKKIWKFPITTEDICSLAMPIGAEILDIGIQGKELKIWAIVDPDADTEDRSFSFYGTGLSIDTEGKKYLKTIQSGISVWHIFEIVS